MTRLQDELGVALDAAWLRAADAGRHRFESGLAALRRSGLVDEAVRSGEMVPDFELPDVHGRPVALGSLLDRGPVIIVFVLSAQCSLCRLTLACYRRALSDLAAAGALAAVSIDAPPAGAPATGDAPADVLSLVDHGGRLAALFGLLYPCPAELRDGFVRLGVAAAATAQRLPLAATYVVDTDGIAAFAHVDPDPLQRPEPALLRATLNGLRAPSAAPGRA